MALQALHNLPLSTCTTRKLCEAFAFALQTFCFVKNPSFSWGMVDIVGWYKYRTCRNAVVKLVIETNRNKTLCVAILSHARSLHAGMDLGQISWIQHFHTEILSILSKEKREKREERKDSEAIEATSW